MARAAKALRFTRLKMVNWRNFRDAELHLTSRAFIVGPNASGKSNLLDALRFLRDLAKPTGGLASSLNEFGRGGFSGVRCLHARKPSHVGFDLDVGTDDDLSRWTYRLHLQRFRGEAEATVAFEEVLRNGKLVTSQQRGDRVDDRLLYSQTFLEQVQRNGDFRELVEFLASIRYLHVVPQIVRDGRRSMLSGEDPFGGDLLRRMKDMPKKTREPRLKKLSEAIGYAVPGFDRLELRDDTEGRPHLFANYQHWRATAARQSEEVFSDGTLRLIGFLWSVMERGGPLLLEEPELSLHETVVAQLPALIARSQSLSGRQVICTTHSEVMLNAPGLRLDEVHRITVGDNGSTIQDIVNDPQIERKVIDAGWPIGQAVLPLTAPASVNKIASVNIVG